MSIYWRSQCCVHYKSSSEAKSTKSTLEASNSTLSISIIGNLPGRSWQHRHCVSLAPREFRLQQYHNVFYLFFTFHLTNWCHSRTPVARCQFQDARRTEAIPPGRSAPSFPATPCGSGEHPPGHPGGLGTQCVPVHVSSCPVIAGDAYIKRLICLFVFYRSALTLCHTVFYESFVLL